MMNRRIVGHGENCLLEQDLADFIDNLLNLISRSCQASSSDAYFFVLSQTSPPASKTLMNEALFLS